MSLFVDCLDTLFSELQYGDRLLHDYLISRYNNEGVRFFAVTLPLVEEALLASLETGFFDRSGLTSFKFKGKLLHHFYGWLSLIYNTDGSLIRPVDEVAFYGLCQLTGYFKKLCLLYPEKTVESSIRDFVSHDNTLKGVYKEYMKSSNELFRKTLRSICTHTFRNFHKSIDQMLHGSPPRFGPGTYSGVPSHVAGLYDRSVTTTVSKLFEKNIYTPFKGIQGFFFKGNRPPSHKNCFFGTKDTSDYSELLLVPKTAKGPRTIVREPLFRLAVQMSFFDSVSKYLERSTNGRIQFTDQGQNNELAQRASLDGSYSTLDLSKASDSVSYEIVKDLLGHIPCISTLLTKFRSRYCKLPCGNLHPLQKLAGMGSGFTFPILALLCHHSICAGILLKYPHYSYNDVMRNVYVYGDDIIVPVDWTLIAVESLRRIGFQVNTLKSFSATSKGSIFRESCGGNYLNGEDVTIKRLRLSQLTSERQTILLNGRAGNSFKSMDVKHLLDFLPVINQLDKHCRELITDGFSKLAEVYYSYIDSYVKALALKRRRFRFLSEGIPQIWKNFEGIGRYSPTFKPSIDSHGNHSEVKSIGVKSECISGFDHSIYDYGCALRKGASHVISSYSKCLALANLNLVNDFIPFNLLALEDTFVSPHTIRRLKPCVVRSNSINSLQVK